MRDLEYAHTVNIGDQWNENDEFAGRYSRSSPWGEVTITSQSLRRGSTLRHFAESVRDQLEDDWWFWSPSLFEITSFQETQIGGRDAYSITSRVRESPEYCIVDVAEIVMLSNSLPGNPQGFRVRAWMCERSVADYGQDRLEMLDSFRIITRPATYYTQFLSVVNDGLEMSHFNGLKLNHLVFAQRFGQCA